MNNSSAKRLWIFAAIWLACAGLPLFAQAIAFPPELRWWLSEVQKANPHIAIDDFKLVKNEEFAFDNSGQNADRFYPIFKRWNFSADKYAYLHTGAILIKQKNGKYALSFDIDSALYLVGADKRILYQEWYGTSSWLNAVAWLRDNALLSVGQEIEPLNQDKAMVHLLIKSYEIRGAKILVATYTYKNAFDNAVRSSLKLNWFEQRPDYFELRQ